VCSERLSPLRGRRVLKGRCLSTMATRDRARDIYHRCCSFTSMGTLRIALEFEILLIHCIMQSCGTQTADILQNGPVDQVASRSQASAPLKRAFEKLHASPSVSISKALATPVKRLKGNDRTLPRPTNDRPSHVRQHISPADVKFSPPLSLCVDSEMMIVLNNLGELQSTISTLRPERGQNPPSWT
jgi:hypothetical protein